MDHMNTEATLPESGAAGSPLSAGTSQELLDAKEAVRLRALQYFSEKNVAGFLDCVLSSLYAARPPDPFDWCIEFLLTRDRFETTPGQRSQSRAARDYSMKWKIPFMVDELLAAMLVAQPDEPYRFALAWLRWNKVSFTMKHFKNGRPPA
ncbi:hypothetical protein DIPPA_10598 [Diplonema papillatum]|nr:hypothetical protein DIPPA_10598 [Diplonema papillatum]